MADAKQSPKRSAPRDDDPPAVTTFWGHVRKALREANRRRPRSFYFLLAAPVVLLGGVHMVQYRDQPLRFALILALLFVFFGVILIQAIMDLFEISRRHYAEYKQSFVETLGAQDFIHELGKRVKDKTDQ